MVKLAQELEALLQDISFALVGFRVDMLARCGWQNEKTLAAADLEQFSTLQRAMLQAEQLRIEKIVSEAILGKKW